MPQQIDSKALELVRQALGLAGGSGASQRVVLEDGLVDQTLEVSQLVASAVATDAGMFLIQATQAHSAAGQIDDVLLPYAPTTIVDPFIQLGDFSDYDIWLLRYGGQVAGTATNLTGMALSLNAQGIMAQTDGTVTLFDQILAAFDGADILDTGLVFGFPGVPLNFRMPRNATGLIFDSQASGAVTARHSLLCQLAPPGLEPSAIK